MIPLNTLYEKICGEVNTHQGGHIRPHRNFVDWVNAISLELFEEFVAVAEKNQMIADYLSPFLVSVNVAVNSVTGSMSDLIKLPKDYEHYSSCRVFLSKKNMGCPSQGLEMIDGDTGCTCEKNPYLDEVEMAALQAMSDEDIMEVSVSKIDNQRWGSVCQHKTQGPSFSKPKITQYDKGLKIAPKKMGVVVLDYYRKPKPATFEYTITNPGNIDEYFQYNTSSQPLEWSEIVINEFLTRLGKKYGKFTREGFLYETSENDRKTTP